MTGDDAIVLPHTGPLRVALRVPGDKSITHRLLILAALARGESRLRDAAPGDDCAASADLLAALSVPVSRGGDAFVVRGRGREALSPPDAPLDARNSGTSARLFAGVLAAAPFESVITGDASLSRRPMERVAAPLRRMGALVETAAGGTLPMRVRGAPLRGIHHDAPVSSAQVKSAVLLAGLAAEETTSFREPHPSRDHTERLLRSLGVPVDVRGPVVSVSRAAPRPFDLAVPGDPSAAAFLAAAAALIPGSAVTLPGVCLNPTRLGFFSILARMGAGVVLSAEPYDGWEPRGTIEVRHAPLSGIEVREDEVPGAVDELPLVGILGAFARGETVVRGAAELRKKESDRIASVTRHLSLLGARVTELPDGFRVEGPTGLDGGEVDPRGDHRIAMAFAVAALAARAPVLVRGAACAGVSWPGFFELVSALR